MAVLQGIGTKGTGKLGSVVYSVNHGVQIAREYQPTVSNPSSTGQVQQRAKLKLMSQLSAALAGVIAYQRDGLVSPRNAFTKANIGQAYTTETVLDETTAAVVYENLQLAQGSFAISGVHILRTEGESVAVNLISSLAPEADRVVYVLARKTDEGLIEIIDTVVESVPGADRLFPHLFGYAAGSLIVWAYGMATANASAKGKYMAYSVSNATDVATLVANRNLIESGVRLSYTRGKTLPYDADESIDVPAGSAAVYASVSGNGSITLGDGTAVSFPQILPIGTSVTYKAVPGENAAFVEWRNMQTGATFSTADTISVTLTDNLDLQAIFQSVEPVTVLLKFAQDPVGRPYFRVDGGTELVPEGGQLSVAVEWVPGSTHQVEAYNGATSEISQLVASPVSAAVIGFPEDNVFPVTASANCTLEFTF